MLPDEKLEQLLRASRHEQFAPGFAGRVVRHARGFSEKSLGDGLRRCFVWLAPAAVTAIALLAIHNSRGDGNARGLDALLGLQPVSVASAYSLAPNP